MIYDEPSGSFQAGAQLKMKMIFTPHIEIMHGNHYQNKPFLINMKQHIIP